MLFDWLHLAAGSLWLGGLVGLLVLWSSVPARERVPTLSVCVPRFSNVALGSVLVLAATGIGEAIEHMPAVNALSETAYGKAILVKAGLLGGAILIASGNLLRSRPRLIAARRRPELGEPAARLLRALVSGEAVVVPVQSVGRRIPGHPRGSAELSAVPDDRRHRHLSAAPAASIQT